jgi:hypothetical protein
MIPQIAKRGSQPRSPVGAELSEFPSHESAEIVV